MSLGSVEENPNPTPGVISEMTTEPFSCADTPFTITRQVAVILSEVTSTRVIPFSKMLPEMRLISF